MKPILRIGLGLTVGLVAWVWWRDRQADDGTVASQGSPAGAPAAQASKPAPVPPDADEPRAPPEPVSLFPAQTWVPPPPPAPPPPPPPPPLEPHELPVPPLPFDVASVWWSVDDFYAVLRVGQEEFPVCARCDKVGFYKPGEVLFGRYRLERVRPDGIDLIYLPREETQHLPLPGVTTAMGKR